MPVNMPMNTSLKKPRKGPPPPRHSACTCGSLRKASRRISQFYDSALAPISIKSTQYSILSEIERSRIPLSMCELATAMVMDRSTLGHNLRPLERDDLLSMQLTASDRRKRHVTLTKKGRDACCARGGCGKRPKAVSKKFRQASRRGSARRAPQYRGER